MNSFRHKAQWLIRHVWFAFLLLAFAYLLFLAHALWRYGQEVTAEYVTVRGIGYVKRYVETHDGRWPSSWADLPPDQEVQRFTRIRFDLTAERIVDDPRLIYTAVLPITGKFETYPHSKEHFDELLELLKESNAKHQTGNRAMPMEDLDDLTQ